MEMAPPEDAPLALPIKFWAGSHVVAKAAILSTLS